MWTLLVGSELATLEVAGGKGAALGRLVRAGFPVPPAVVVTTAAYRAFMEENGLAAVVVERCRALRHGEPDGLHRASRVIREAIEAAPITPAMGAAIAEAVAPLRRAGAPGTREDAFAVRSSATAEDLPEASFAGQQESSLNVAPGEPLLRAVKRCWASLFLPRALAYRARRGIAHDEVSLAVIVQCLVDAGCAGTLSTRNPVTDDRHQIIVTANFGLGTTITDGVVTPDTWAVDKRTGQVLYETIGEKAVMAELGPEGTRLAPVERDRRRRPSLAREGVVALAEIARKIEACFGAPQEIEWAMAGGRIYVLQSRPMTALAAAAE